MKKWVTIFPDCENVHLVKDVGYIPYIMHKKFNYKSSIVTFNNDEYSYQNNIVKGLELEFLNSNSKNKHLDIILYIIKNAKQIDVLHLFHIKITNLFYFYIYKKLNPEGKCYLKLDGNENLKKINMNSLNLKHRLYSCFFKYCDLISIETIRLQQWLNENWKYDVKYIPNGFWKNDLYDSSDLQKEKIITTVGRLGIEIKNNELLIESFRMIYEKIPNWKLCLVGEMTDSFEEYLKKLFIQIPQLKEKIIIEGKVTDLKKLNEIYAKSEVFCLTSNSESFGLVFVEALKNGCYIITTDVLAAPDITNNGDFGRIVQINDFEQLKDALLEVCSDTYIRPSKSQIRQFAHQKFDWNNIADKIEQYLNE